MSNTTTCNNANVENIEWDHPNIPIAIGVSIGAGLATGIGGALVFFPEMLKKVPQATLLAISLALSARPGWCRLCAGDFTSPGESSTSAVGLRGRVGDAARIRACCALHADKRRTSHCSRA